MKLKELPALPKGAGGKLNPGHDLERKVEGYEQTILALEALRPRKQSEKYFLRFDEAYYRHAFACGELLVAFWGYLLAGGSVSSGSLGWRDKNVRRVLRDLATTANEWLEVTGGWLTPMGIVARLFQPPGRLPPLYDDEIGILSTVFSGPGWEYFLKLNNLERNIWIVTAGDPAKERALKKSFTQAHTRIVFIHKDPGNPRPMPSSFWRMGDVDNNTPLWIDTVGSIDQYIQAEFSKKSPLNIEYWNPAIRDRGVRLGKVGISPRSIRTLLVLLTLIQISLEGIKIDDLKPFRSAAELVGHANLLTKDTAQKGGENSEKNPKVPEGKDEEAFLEEDGLRHALAVLRKKLVHPQMGGLLLEKKEPGNAKSKAYCLHPTTFLLLQLGAKPGTRKD